MASSCSRILRECLLVVTVLSMAACKAADASGLVEKVCQQDPDDAFCLRTLNGNRGTADADRYELAAIAFQMAFSDAKNSLDYIDSLLNDSSGPSKDPIIRGYLQQCRVNYDHAVTKFVQAGNDINSETYDLLGSYATAAGNDADDCQSEFGGSTSPLDDNNLNLKGYSRIGVAIETLFS